ncbi:ATP-binding protein [Burkholderia vietnamiensis]|uniref:ATP-binding protein n=1 Tax=Burkholderia vietnamiensis TaxID=60552 RepID=UPI000756CC32|nr:ATP-binding protein [Burkholderia vietnamiensis]AOJ99138.1 hybrid sensor histidine kinase/response regulator [Burkholderia vietnamiensis]KVF76400.1 hybrid sensor histidine kinase/response regulator [Burkholderia vietnamiensis]KVF90517.1 hybrid sensor histidine kinase/response regulator [Burkholderia vietnamiensis]KVF91391.1 hybrid sensor histidine kinase/response regulator [Burkholderia vietnamiensis]KVG04244.1 hybrid sensor histidine kinase/response regulator [Burkholderia vietnamiensis]
MRVELFAQHHGCPGWEGEMARRIAAFDWSEAGLGPIEQWSASLIAAVRTVLASPLPLVMLWGRPGYMIYNDAYAAFSGGRHPYLLGKPVELGWPEVADFNRNVMNTCLAGGTLSYRDKELVLLRHGRPEDVWMDLHYSPLADDDGAPGGVLAVVIETTERVLATRQRAHAEAALQASNDALRRLTETLEQRVADALAERAAIEEQLRHAQKMEAIGSLTGGIAHDFNNVLQVISGNLQVLAVELGERASAQPRIESANNAVRRGAQLASHLLAFARRQPLSPTVLNPRKLIDGMSEMLHRALGETVRVVAALAPDVGNVLADRHQLENALLNLAINARDAMRGDGTLTIAAYNDTTAVGARRTPLPPGEYVTFEITDTGSGMTPDVLERVFEPFFTTKPDGEGTGLGLSMVFGFVKQSGGHTAIDSAPGQGTTVRLTFPRCHDAFAEEPACAPRPDPVRGRETILIVEDDADVRLTVVDMLAQLGYKVLSASDGEAALRILDSGTPIDLLFTDVIMPGHIKGGELARRAAQRTPPLPVLFTSGYTRDEIFHSGRLDPGVMLLGKPYRRDELAARIRSVLDRNVKAA